ASIAPRSPLPNCRRPSVQKPLAHFPEQQEGPRDEELARYINRELSRSRFAQDWHALELVGIIPKLHAAKIHRERDVEPGLLDDLSDTDVIGSVRVAERAHPLAKRVLK